MRRHQNMRVFYLELGVDGNAPVITTYPFWQMTARNPRTTYALVA